MISTYIVDSFTNQAFKGNPAGVCLLDKTIDDQLMLSIAQELGLSETAFVQQVEKSSYTIRFFSPKMEIPLCGHATLAASKVLFSLSDVDVLTFINVNKLKIPVEQIEAQIRMEFPVYETSPAECPDRLLHALGIESIINCEYNAETNILLLEMSDCEQLALLNPDFSALVISHDSINGVLVTARSSDSKYDFHSRYFWPWSGTNEDPATGGTHTFLSKYWSDRLGKQNLKSYQSSARSGQMDLEIVSPSKLYITSDAVIVFEGNLNI